MSFKTDVRNWLASFKHQSSEAAAQSPESRERPFMQPSSTARFPCLGLPQPPAVALGNPWPLPPNKNYIQLGVQIKISHTPKLSSESLRLFQVVQCKDQVCRAVWTPHFWVLFGLGGVPGICLMVLCGVMWFCGLNLSSRSYKGCTVHYWVISLGPTEILKVSIGAGAIA